MSFFPFLIPILFYYISVRFFLDNILEPRQLKWWNKILVAIYIIVFNYLCLLYTAHNNWLFLVFILNYCITFLLAKFLYRVSFKQLIVLCFIYSILGMLTERIVVSFLFSGQMISLNLVFFVRLIVDIVLLIFTKIWHSFFKQRGLIEQDVRFPNTLLLIPLLSIFFLHYLTSIDGDELSTRSLMECFFIFGLNIFVFLFFDKTLERDQIKTQNIFYSTQLRYFEKFNSELEKHQTELDMKNHDFKNHLISISGYLKENDHGQLQSYLDEISISEPSLTYTGCTPIDALLHFYKKEFSERNVDFQITTHVPYKLPFKDSDLSIIIGNLLQNALDAQGVGQNQKEKKVVLSMNYDMYKLMINVENPFQTSLKRDGFERFLSTKQMYSQKRRGLGLKSIEKTLEHYQHLMEINTDNNIFSVTIIIYVNDK